MTDRSVALVAPDQALLEHLLPVARRIFTETFGALYDRGDFERFCDATYRPGGTMSRDFVDPRVQWRVATAWDEPIGYAKLTPLRAPAARPQAGAMELQQIYVLSDWQGAGVAARLMDWSLATARAQGAPEIYLTVFDHNERAKRFYARHGFEEVGRCTFQLGERIDDDRIWRARLDVQATLSPEAAEQQVMDDEEAP
jgi:ribosomal protein S18 acetylase RimI-like enzyme